MGISALALESNCHWQWLVPSPAGEAAWMWCGQSVCRWVCIEMHIGAGEAGNVKGRVPRASQQFSSHTVALEQSEDKIRSLVPIQVVVNWIIP